jgi:predicted ribosomally synthesized peptide with SipW-like signal peptide
MKKILLSIGSLVFTGAILVGGTGAYLSDREVSTGNTFATGIIDLKVDNESYFTNDFGDLTFSSSTSWKLSNLAGKLFFNFPDVKPGDIGEDTISLHINNNNAWACMNLKITATPENGQTGPEDLVDPTGNDNGGELQENLYFKFWADDGDNVYEQGEQIFKYGWAKNVFDGKNITLADSKGNIWGQGPLPANTVKYIGKAWCFGDMTVAPIPQDGLGKTGSNGPLVRGTGFKCEGERIGNIVQSDGIKADVSFFVIQSRNNKKFVCSDYKNDKSDSKNEDWSE